MPSAANALGDDFIYTVVVLHAAQRAVVQALTPPADAAFAPDDATSNSMPSLLEHLARHLEHLRTVAALARRAVDCYNFHILFLQMFFSY